MSRKSKIDPALKVELVEKYLRDEIGIYEAARLAGMSGKTAAPVRRWVNIYENEGPSGLSGMKLQERPAQVHKGECVSLK